MRFESVKAHAFGALRNQSLEFASGMNVVCGPNEAGKSTWHAALCLGLCGMRRGKGKKTEDQSLEDRHRPWDRADAWGVDLTIRLQDGRRVALCHDFAAKLSSARDVDIAERDYQAEVLSEGAPDGSRWLGLNRKSFLQSACVRQADLLAVRDDPGGLQDELQAAAGNAERDATAARALASLEDFRKERVGSPRAPTKPLVKSRSEVEAARKRLEEARATNEEHRAKSRHVEELERQAEDCGRQLRLARAAQARQRADEARQRLAMAGDLAAEFPTGAPPAIPNDAQRMAEVVAAIATWANLPALRRPEGETLPALAQQKSAAGAALAAAENAKPSRKPSFASAVAAVALLVCGGVLVAVPHWAAFGAVPAVLALVVLWWASRQAKLESARRIASEQSVLTERHRALVREIDHRRVEEEAYDQGVRRKAAAAQLLQQTAAAIGGAGDTPEENLQALADWQAARPAKLAAAEEAQRRWSELKGLLGGKPIEALEEESEACGKEAERLLAECDPRDLDTAERLPPLSELAEREKRAEVELANARGALSAHRAADVAEAEDACAAARQRARRVERLDATVETTIRFLRDAEEKVHRDVARTLRGTMLQWLAAITDGRYTDCRVNPATLEVEVRAADGPWRNAELLSHGTSEQIYLIVRLALVAHLTAKKEISPLILDDVVSASDGVRSRAILETLLAISEKTQVILFSHDDAVRQWARERLADLPAHRLIDLQQIAEGGDLPPGEAVQTAP